MAGTHPTILVTGGAGYIVSHAVLALKDAGYSVVVIDTLVTGFDWAVLRDVPLVRGDIADPHRLMLELFCMLDHLVGLLLQALIAQGIGAKPLQVQRALNIASGPGRLVPLLEFGTGWPLFSMAETLLE